GFVVLDAAEIFLNLPNARKLPFPGPYEEVLETAGSLIADRAIQEGRSIVTEMIGTEDDDAGSIALLIQETRKIGYEIDLVGVDAKLEVCLERNRSRGEENISSYYTEGFHRTWLVKAIAKKMSCLG